MDNSAPTPARKSQDIVKAELERRSRNLYKVYNPTNQPHQVTLNARISPEIWTIPAKEEIIVPWYVAEKYFLEMTQKIITIKSDRAIIEENDKRRSKGFPAMDLHTEQPRFEGRMIKGLEGKRKAIVAVLNRGLYQEYGVGGDKTPTIDRRTEKATFDAGIDVESPNVSTTPQEPPKIESDEIEDVKSQILDDSGDVPQTTIVEEPDEEEAPTYVSKKDRAKQNG
mgnify:CR=1 FL=1